MTAHPTTSTALVGPLPTITFGGGPGDFFHRARQAYDVPRDTRDPRYPVCVEHHPACDCREAELAEEIGELRMVIKQLEDAVRTVLAGHRVIDWDQPWHETRRGRGGLACQCTGCQIARRVDLSLSWITDDNGVVTGGHHD